MKPELLFIFHHQYEDFWRDGLWAALEVLGEDFTVVKWNMALEECPAVTAAFTLGWGAFGGPVDKQMQKERSPKGLCIAGNTFPPLTANSYDVLFYETEWSRQWLLHHSFSTTGELTNHSAMIHAFGINSEIYHEADPVPKIWDYTTVGAFAYWKRQRFLFTKQGYKLAIGEIQEENAAESLDIIGQLLLDGVAISDMVPPETLAKIYRASQIVYIPADIHGGGERAVLEARACGIEVEVEADNAKLAELLTIDPIWDEHYYARQLRKGINQCIIGIKEVS